MNPKLLRRLFVSVVVVGAFAGLYYYTHAPLLRIRLKDGTEIRVLKVAYGTGVNQEHELYPPSRLKLRLLGLLPQSWQNRLNTPGEDSSYLPGLLGNAISVWWTYNLPPKHTDIPGARPVINVGRAFVRTLYPGGDTRSFPGAQGYTVAPNQPQEFVFPCPRPLSKTFQVNFTFNDEPVTFTVPIPAPSE